ncbi:MAG: hypothetical protein RL088_1870 [Verrucomicrobiota bacterium]
MKRGLDRLILAGLLNGIRLVWAALLIVAAGNVLRGQDTSSRPWSDDVIYFVLTDRFADGDASNNIPEGSDPKLYDPRQLDIVKYHGGDLRGLEKAIAAGYFEKLGVTAIWITPPVKNVWYSLADLGGPKTGYHGYWTQNFLDIDPHLVSRKSFNGAVEYPDSRDGRMQHYKDFVALAHKHGLKVIQDVVCNHAGPVFYYDANGNGRHDRDELSEWQQPFRKDGYYANARWMNIPEWNALQTQPAGPETILGRQVATSGILQKLEAYGRKGMSGDSLGRRDGEEVVCDFFSLRDIWTDPNGEHFDAVVNEFVEIYRFYIETVGVDGLRIDTVKHVHREFWEAFTERLRGALGPERAKRLLMFGEVYDGSPEVAGRYTYRQQWPERKDPSLDSVLSFDFCFAARQFLRHSNDEFGSPLNLEAALKNSYGPHYNPTPGLDGLNARQKMVNFVENHDGLNRFRAWKVNERSNILANALVLFSEGIPCLYYGTEAALLDLDGKLTADTETGRMTFLRTDEPARMQSAVESATFSAIAHFTKLRRELPALSRGATVPLWVDSADTPKDDGIFAFARYTTTDAVLVVVNASKASSVTGMPGAPMQLVAPKRPLLTKSGVLKLEAVYPAGGAVIPEVKWSGRTPHVEITMPPRSVAVFSAN